MVRDSLKQETRPSMKWPIKCVIDSSKAVLPFQPQLRSLKDRFSPYQPDILENDHTISQGIKQVQWVRQTIHLEGATVLEIGSGWEPLIPMIYSLAGASKVLLTALNVLLRPDTFAGALACLRQHKESLVRELGIDRSLLEYALRDNPSMSMEARLEELRMVYMAPCDCRDLPLPSGLVDVVTSRACLEHVPPDVIEGIFQESFRVLCSGGVTCHVVDHSDHWEHYDKSITRVNFLKFSESFWKWTHINPLNYQDRLRHPEYVDMLRRAGLRLLKETHRVDEASLRALSKMRLAKRFERFTPEDLASLDSWLLAAKN